MSDNVPFGVQSVEIVMAFNSYVAEGRLWLMLEAMEQMIQIKACFEGVHTSKVAFADFRMQRWPLYST